jgi:hypothetical protein
MRPTLLRPGAKVSVKGIGRFNNEMTFVERFRDAGNRPVNVFQCAAFVGLNGPGDKGLCEISDYRVSREVTFIGRDK